MERNSFIILLGELIKHLFLDYVVVFNSLNTRLSLCKLVEDFDVVLFEHFHGFIFSLFHHFFLNLYKTPFNPLFDLFVLFRELLLDFIPEFFGNLVHFVNDNFSLTLATFV